MADPSAENVPRTPGEPTPEQVLEAMTPCEPYTVSDLVDRYDDTSRWTVQRRLDTLVEDGEVSKKNHTKNRVSYWISGSTSGN
jgi:DNA-binding HxlR family transcriptional regulator